jgi:glyceraldehyde-3-phosphate dehydrogenase (NADP+)
VKHRLWIAGGWQDGKGAARDIRSPYSGETVAAAEYADAAQLEQALAATDEAFRAFRRSSAYLRSRLLAAIAAGIAARRRELADSIVREAGKPFGLADAEVGRAISTFTIASEEAKRMGGELIPVDLDPASRAYGAAASRWVPRGPVLAIAPYNFPLNLVAHKVAPALAVGCAVVVKPAPQAPGAATILAEIFEKAAREASDAREAVPLAALQLVNAANDVTAKAITDPRIATLSFTGSDKVGWALQQLAVRKKVALELGGNAAVVVHSDADLARAAARVAFGGFAYAGQICISVQRVFVHKSVAPKFTDLLVGEIAKLKVGDPAQTDTVVGPLIDQAHADKVSSSIDESVKGGARVLTGGKRKGNLIEPTVITGARETDKVASEEIFGPVVVLDVYEDFSQAIAAVNRSRFGLQAGVFTDSAKLIRQASDDLDVGGILINEIPTFRADNMPYGGVKESGLGREGVRYAMEDFCERRVVVSWQG